MQIAALIFPDMDQLDFTGPFEVLARLPQAQIHIVWKDRSPVRDSFGLLLTPTATLQSALPPLDVWLSPADEASCRLWATKRYLRG